MRRVFAFLLCAYSTFVLVVSSSRGNQIEIKFYAKQ